MYDISLPLIYFYELVPKLAAEFADLGDRVLVNGLGHLGDCNLHLSVKFDDESLKDRIESFVYNYVKEKRGSISAEHGIGFLKTKHLKGHKDAAALQQMQELKKFMDPNTILNPYKVLTSN